MGKDRVEVKIERFKPDQQRICLGAGRGYLCSAINQNTYCRLANLQGTLRKKPTVGDAERAMIDAGSIPERCPNGYKSPNRLEL